MTDEELRGKARKIPMNAETGHINASPTRFHLWAKEYLDRRRSVQFSDWSPVPCFLLCRAMELEFKAVHLDVQPRADVKKVKNYKHNLVELYKHLPDNYKNKLSQEQVELLEQVNKIYDNKRKGGGFEYFNVRHEMRGHSNLPKLKDLDALADSIFGLRKPA
jgi:hypothetical protein